MFAAPVIFNVEVIVAKALKTILAAALTVQVVIVALLLKFIVAAAFTLQAAIVILLVKLSVAACETVIAPVVHAAVFDHVPEPLKNTGPKVFPPELIVFVPVPKKYTFIPVAHVPCNVVMVRLP